MSTFINLGLVSLNKRFNEVEIVLAEAQNHFEKNELLYNALCRSAQVLLLAHFEGYLKDLVKNALEDINQYSSFKSSNYHLKKRLCEYFISPSKEEKYSKDNHIKVTELIKVFDDLETKFKREYFTSENKNPKATVLDKIAEQFGVKNFFKQIKKSKLDLIFSNTNAGNIEMCGTIKSYILDTTKEYPFTTSLDFLDIDDSKKDSDNLWDAFLSDILKRRHDIAHGSEIDNSVGHSIIESDKVKVEILIYAFTAFICIMANPIEVEELTA
ncbi:MAG: hypothetical protein JSR97_10530 [Verrucomicrobia bacterium]|nr:hypothetical protein [Verrucomicrobiota bacterium]